MSTFLTAEWRKLIMAQYTVDPATLAPWLPAGVELDFYKDRCYVSLVGFLFDEVRVKGLRIPFHTKFEEVNLRFYVKRTDPDGTQKRGVVFIREFVPRAAITLIANMPGNMRDRKTVWLFCIQSRMLLSQHRLRSR